MSKFLKWDSPLYPSVTLRSKYCEYSDYYTVETSVDNIYRVMFGMSVLCMNIHVYKYMLFGLVFMCIRFYINLVRLQHILLFFILTLAPY